MDCQESARRILAPFLHAIYVFPMMYQVKMQLWNFITTSNCRRKPQLMCKLVPSTALKFSKFRLLEKMGEFWTWLLLKKSSQKKPCPQLASTWCEISSPLSSQKQKKNKKNKALCKLNTWEWTNSGASLPVFWHGIGKSETFSLPPIAEGNKANVRTQPFCNSCVPNPLRHSGFWTKLHSLPTPCQQQPDMPAKTHPHMFPSTWGETFSPLSIQKEKQVVICEPKTWENKWLSCCTSDYGTQLGRVSLPCPSRVQICMDCLRLP